MPPAKPVSPLAETPLPTRKKPCHCTCPATDGKTTDYIGNFVYEDNQLKYILTAEGRIVPKAEGGYDYQYFLKDHL
ncbi:MAG: hypothetical protein L3J31_02995, partial [Bacteroidales bacterium]|nr:hypothetical protein [Bacteroidales bacterium]